MMWTSDLPWTAINNYMLYVMFMYNTSNPSTWIVLLSEYCWSLRLNKRTLKWQQLAIPKHMQFYFNITSTPPTSGWITSPPNLRMEFSYPWHVNKPASSLPDALLCCRTYTPCHTYPVMFSQYRQGLQTGPNSSTGKESSAFSAAWVSDKSMQVSPLILSIYISTIQ